MILYKRHKKDCQYRQGSGKDKNQSHRCKCSVWVEWNTNGKQRRHPVRDAAGQSTSSWSEAEKLAGRNTETTGNPAVAPKGQDSITVEKAIKLFLESKQGEDLAENTLVKHKLTLRRLQEYCDGEGIALLADATLPTLASWRAGWTYKSPIAKRNNQERVRAFFRFCVDGELISKNPAKKKEGDTWTVPNPSDPRSPTEFMILRGKRLRKDKSTNYNWIPDGTTMPNPQAVGAQTAPDRVKAPEPKLEDKLRALIPYLDVKHGIVTFGRVRNDMRHIDGRPVRELLEGAGIIDTKLNLTAKGKTWLSENESHGNTTDRTTDD